MKKFIKISLPMIKVKNEQKKKNKSWGKSGVLILYGDAACIDVESIPLLYWPEIGLKWVPISGLESSRRNEKSSTLQKLNDIEIYL